MKQLKITITGKRESDLAIALDEVKRKVETGFLTGFDGNDSGSYIFDITEARK